jgi:hypothetical protein
MDSINFDVRVWRGGYDSHQFIFPEHTLVPSIKQKKEGMLACFELLTLFTHLSWFAQEESI